MVMLLMMAVALGGDGGASTKKVRIDGHTYRVTVRGDRVEVANKSMLVVNEPLLERDARRRAVQEATGCALRDELKQGALLLGRLECRHQGE